MLYFSDIRMANAMKLGQYFCLMWDKIFLKVMNAISLFSHRATFQGKMMMSVTVLLYAKVQVPS